MIINRAGLSATTGTDQQHRSGGEQAGTQMSATATLRLAARRLGSLGAAGAGRAPEGDPGIILAPIFGATALSGSRRYGAEWKRARRGEGETSGELTVQVPEGIRCEYTYPNLRVTGPLGVKEQNLKIYKQLGIRLSEDGKSLAFRAYTPELVGSARLNQLARSLETSFHGVTAGYRKDLQLRGLGFKWALDGDVLTMNIGFSHEVRYAFPPTVKCTVTAPTELFLESVCKDEIGRTAKDLLKLPRRDAYKGKGIFLKGDYPKLKEAKRK